MNRMPNEVVLVLEVVMVVGGLIAAAFWLASANVTVPEDQDDSFIAALQRIAKLNSIGAAGASAAAVAALVLWATSE